MSPQGADLREQEAGGGLGEGHLGARRVYVKMQDVMVL